MKFYRRSLLVLLVAFLSFITMTRVVQASALTIAGDNEIITEDVDGALLITGNNVTVDADVNGIILGAGNQVVINGQVSGPAFLAGNGVSFNGQGEDVFMAGNTITVGPDAEVSRDAFLAGSTVSINSAIGRDIFVGSESLNLSSEVGRDAYLGLPAEGINFSGEGQIRGDLTYSSERRNEQVEENVDGEVTFVEQRPAQDYEPSQQAKVATFFWKLIGAVLSAWLIWWIANRLTNYRWMLLRTDTRNVWLTLAIGLASLIVWPIVTILMLVTTVLVLPSFIMGALYLALILLGMTKLSAMIEQNYLSQRFSRIRYPRVLAFLTTFIVLYLVAQLPYVGWIVGLVAAAYGVGIAVQDFFHFMRVPDQAPRA